MSEIAAALGLSQLKKLKKFVKTRNLLAENYKKLLKDLPVKHQEIILNNKSSYHLFIILLDLKRIKKNYNNIFNALRKNGVLVNMHYRPIHLQPFYRNKGFKIGNFPVAEWYGKSALSLPLYVDLKFKDQEKIIKILRKIIL